MATEMNDNLRVALRPIRREDLAVLYQFGLEPEANAMAGSKPRTWETFEPRWLELMEDRSATMRVIVWDGQLVGAINVLVMDEVESVGYWIGREFWGRGIASRAVALMCKEVTMRPLFATTAEWNHASLRVLMKHGFVEESREWTVETERSVARVTVKLKLG